MDVSNDLNKIVQTVQDSVEADCSENIADKENILDKNLSSTDSTPSQETAHSDSLNIIKEINDNIPDIIDRFRKAIDVIEDATQTGKFSAQEKALVYFYKNGYFEK